MWLREVVLSLIFGRGISQVLCTHPRSSGLLWVSLQPLLELADPPLPMSLCPSSAGAGVFFLSSAEGEQISFLFDCIVRGISPTKGPFGLRPVLPGVCGNVQGRYTCWSRDR